MRSYKTIRIHHSPTNKKSWISKFHGYNHSCTLQNQKNVKAVNMINMKKRHHLLDWSVAINVRLLQIKEKSWFYFASILKSQTIFVTLWSVTSLFPRWYTVEEGLFKHSTDDDSKHTTLPFEGCAYFTSDESVNKTVD